MEVINYIKKYDTLNHDVKEMLNKIVEMGFDIKKYDLELKNVEYYISENANNEEKCKQAYMKGIDKLYIIKKELYKYEVYYRIFNSCKWLEIRVNDKNISCSALQNYVNEIINDLNIITRSGAMNNNYEKHIAIRLFNVAYNIIKLELIMNGESKLYKHFKDNNIDDDYFNTLVKADIERLSNDSEKDKLLKEKVYEINKQGFDNDLFDLDLIKTIIMNDDNYQDIIRNNISSIITEISDSDNKLVKLTDSIEELKDNYENKYENMKKNKRSIKNRIILFIATLSVIITGCNSVKRETKNIASRNVYKKNVEVYSTLDNKTTNSEEDVIFDGNLIDNTVLRVYEPYNGDEERKYLSYNLSDFDYASAEEYYMNGIDDYNGIVGVGSLRQSNGDIIPEYPDSYTEVTKVDYDLIGDTLDKDEYKKMISTFYCLNASMVLFLDIVYSIVSKKEYPLITYSIIKIKKLIDEYNSDKIQYEELNYILYPELNKLMLEINKNDDLRDKFNKLYRENIHLLDNPQELYIRVFGSTKIDLVDNAKKLVKDKRG